MQEREKQEIFLAKRTHLRAYRPPSGAS